MYKFDQKSLLAAGMSRADVAALQFMRNQTGNSDSTMSLDQLKEFTVQQIDLNKAAVDELALTVTTLSSAVTDMQSTISSISLSLSSINAHLAQLDTKTDATNVRVLAAETQITALKAVDDEIITRLN